MLFAQHANQIQFGITSTQNQIDELEAQLKALRSDKAALEAELQQILTLEGAAESALNQAQSFISAADSLGRSDLINTFWTALDAMRNSEMPQLPASEPEPEAEPTTPTPPIEPEPAITVEATPDTDTQPTESETPPLAETNGKQPLKSLGSAAFNPLEAPLDELKRWVRSHLDDDTIRRHGKLTHRSTWESAAKSILE